MVTRIFISYRRVDSKTYAGRLYDRLIDQFNSTDVFKDVDAIPPGLDFRTVLLEAVESCQVLLVLIGPQWLSVINPSGERRIDNAEDFVRLEVEAGLIREDCRVIPLLVDNASMPSDENLPETMKELAYCNAMPLRDDPDFTRDVQKLINELREIGIASRAGEETSKPIDILNLIDQYFIAIESKDWKTARETLAIIRSHPELVNMNQLFNLSRRETQLWELIAHDERDRKYALVKRLLHIDEPHVVYYALQTFWLEFPDYDPENVALQISDLVSNSILTSPTLKEGDQLHNVIINAHLANLNGSVLYRGSLGRHDVVVKVMQSPLNTQMSNEVRDNFKQLRDELSVFSEYHDRYSNVPLFPKPFAKRDAYGTALSHNLTYGYGIFEKISNVMSLREFVRKNGRIRDEIATWAIIEIVTSSLILEQAMESRVLIEIHDILVQDDLTYGYPTTVSFTTLDSLRRHAQTVAQYLYGINSDGGAMYAILDIYYELLKGEPIFKPVSADPQILHQSITSFVEDPDIYFSGISLNRDLVAIFDSTFTAGLLDKRYRGPSKSDLLHSLRDLFGERPVPPRRTLRDRFSSFLGNND